MKVLARLVPFESCDRDCSMLPSSSGDCQQSLWFLACRHSMSPLPPSLWRSPWVSVFSHGHLLMRTWVILYKVHTLLQYVVQSLSCVWLFVTPQTVDSRLPCPSLSPGLCSNSCPLNQWCHPTISTSVAPFSFCPQSLPASRSFWMSWLFTSGGQSTGASVSASVLPMNSQGWFPLGVTGLTSVLSKGLSRVFFSTTIRNH